MEEPNYSKREIDAYFKQLFDRLDKQDAVMGRIESNQTDSLIRIAKLEDMVSDYPQTKSIVASLLNYRWWIIGFGGALVMIGGALYALLYNQIDTKIADGINSAFNERFSKVQVINNN